MKIQKYKIGNGKKPVNEQLAKTKAPKFLYSLKYLTSKLLTNSSKKQIGKR